MGWMHDSKIFLKNSKYFLFFGLAKVEGLNVELLEHLHCNIDGNPLIIH